MADLKGDSKFCFRINGDVCWETPPNNRGYELATEIFKQTKSA